MSDEVLFTAIYNHEAWLTARLRQAFHLSETDAFEVVSCVLIKAFKNRHRFSPRKGSLRTWLWVIAERTAMDLKRKEKRVRIEAMPPEELEELPVVEKEISPDEWLKKRLVGALARLPKRQREVLRLYYWEGLSCVEIGQRLGLSPRQARYAFKKGMDAVRQMINKGTEKGGKVAREGKK